MQSRPFLDEMLRFLPQEVLERTLYKAKFSTYLATTVAELINRVVQQLDSGRVSEAAPPFPM